MRRRRGVSSTSITGNAVENRHMLIINTALGLRTHARVGFWAAA